MSHDKKELIWYKALGSCAPLMLNNLGVCLRWQPECKEVTDKLLVRKWDTDKIFLSVRQEASDY